LADLDRISFAQWLGHAGLTDERLRWYLDYCCRDDYGAGLDTVSAWAGVHYYASRHGFHPPGAETAERDGVFTWPEGNAWLVQRLAAPLAGRLHTGRTALHVAESRHGVQVLAWDEANAQAEAWTAGVVVLALPLFVAARILESPPPALAQAAALLQYAPWLVANLRLNEPLLDRAGAPPSWDNVVYGGRGLGYVDAMHQSLRPVAGPTVLTAYHALPLAERPALLAADTAPWCERVLRDLQLAHPDLRRRVQGIDLMRWGHAMAIPRPGLQRHPALAALRAQRGRVRFAHADLAAYSVFEEAFTAGCEVALPRPPAG
jgi:monoamine oxidase